MKTFDRITIIFNPQSTGDGPALAKELADGLAGHMRDTPIDLVATNYAGHAARIARTAAAIGRPLIVSVSGDGGYNEVVNGVMASGNPQAVATVLAAGNANDHARAVQDQPLLELIIAGQTNAIDLLGMTVEHPDGTTEHRFAHSYIGFGITSTIAAELEKGGKGAIKEVLTTIRTFGGFRPFKIELSDGTTTELDSLLLANITEMAKYATLSSDGDPTDGRFEVITIPHTSKLKVALTVAQAALTDLGDQPSVRNYEFKTLQPMPAQLDGEVWELIDQRRIRIQCHARALKTLTFT